MEAKKVISRENFVQIKAESLSIYDDFLQYKAKTECEKKTKELIVEAIKKEVKNFWRPRFDPSFIDESETDICFVPGKLPAIGKPYYWWKDIAQKYNLKVGTRLQYGAFLGVLIKTLVDEGNTVEWAWNAVCNNSKELGHYWDSKDAKHTFEPTGSRCICGFYDLANTTKYLAEDKETGGFWFAGGFCYAVGEAFPIADICHSTHRIINYGNVGWLVA